MQSISSSLIEEIDSIFHLLLCHSKYLQLPPSQTTHTWGPSELPCVNLSRKPLQARRRDRETQWEKCLFSVHRNTRRDLWSHSSDAGFKRRRCKWRKKKATELTQTQEQHAQEERGKWEYPCVFFTCLLPANFATLSATAIRAPLSWSMRPDQCWPDISFLITSGYVFRNFWGPRRLSISKWDSG